MHGNRCARTRGVTGPATCDMLKHLPNHLVIVHQLPQMVVVAVQPLLEYRHHQNQLQRHPRPIVLRIPIRRHVAAQ